MPMRHVVGGAGIAGILESFSNSWVARSCEFALGTETTDGAIRGFGSWGILRLFVIRLMDKILHDPKDPKLWELWYIPYNG